MIVTPSELIWYGRTFDFNKIKYFNYSCSGFEFCFTGKKAEANFFSDAEKWQPCEYAVLGVYICEIPDEKSYVSTGFWQNFCDNEPIRITLEKNNNNCVLFESQVEKTVVIKVLKLSECAFANCGLENIKIDGRFIKNAPQIQKSNLINNLKIEFIGDSITCGYGVEGHWNETEHFTTQTERPDKAYAFLTAKALNAEFQLCSWSGIGITSNYVDPATATKPDTHLLMPDLWPFTDKSGQTRMNLEPQIWDELNFSPDIIVINLGTNDTSWVQNVEERRTHFFNEYLRFLKTIHKRSPNAKICCCLGIMGQELYEYVEKASFLFSQEFPQTKIISVKFDVQLESDGIGTDWHPNAITQKKASQKLITELKNL